MHELHQACSGWVAKYEVFPADQDSHPTISVTIPLDPDEIWLSIHQSMWAKHMLPKPAPSSLEQKGPENAESVFKLHFPLAISPTISTFVILRDMYEISPDTLGQDVSYSTTRLQFDFQSKVRERWQPSYYSGKLQNRLNEPLWDYHWHRIFEEAKPYLYFWTFSFDGSYLHFRDEENGADSNMAIWDRVEAEWVMASRITSSLPCENEVSVAIQRDPCLVVIAFEDRVLLWPFNSGMSIPPKQDKCIACKCYGLVSF